MTCQKSSTLLSLLAEISTLRRPALLLRTARFGTADYNRDTDLRRILRLPATPPPGPATLRQILDLEAQIDTLRTRPPHEVGDPWRAARHIDVLIALICEARMLSHGLTPLAVVGDRVDAD